MIKVDGLLGPVAGDLVMTALDAVAAPPPKWCDAHHICHWADAGPTALSNLKLLCRYLHTLAHRKKGPRRSRCPSDGLRPALE
jgi:hypothetical protein